MGADPRRSRRRREALAPLLGGDARIDAVEQLLERRALEWAGAVAGESGAVVDRLPFGAALAGNGPTLLVWPELPLWLPETGSAALADLEAGCSASIGRVFDGGLYLLALAQPIPDLVDALSAGPTMGRALRVVGERRLEVGLLRPERGLREPDDLHALLADPLTDAELLGLLE
jgi:glycosyltransferase A (GT-A) superfamily protein (DUF2064 family)